MDAVEELKRRLQESEERYENLIRKQQPLTERSTNQKVKTCVIDCIEKPSEAKEFDPRDMSENKHPGFQTLRESDISKQKLKELQD